jgi:hypothetical protein
VPLLPPRLAVERADPEVLRRADPGGEEAPEREGQREEKEMIDFMVEACGRTPIGPESRSGTL